MIGQIQTSQCNSLYGGGGGWAGVFAMAASRARLAARRASRACLACMACAFFEAARRALAVGARGVDGAAAAEGAAATLARAFFRRVGWKVRGKPLATDDRRGRLAAAARASVIRSPRRHAAQA